jgi:DNA-binding NtrC family response regulator
MELQQGIRRDSTATPSSRESVPFDDVRKRVLIVEDDDAVASLYRRVLTRPDYQLYRACDGDEAVSFVENTPFDAIVSDLAMPGMNGVALLKFIRNHDREVPIVIVTGKPELDSAITAVECGALRYLLKPVCIQELRDTVAQAVGVRSATGSPRGTPAMAADEVESAPAPKSISADFGQRMEHLRKSYRKRNASA